MRKLLKKPKKKHIVMIIGVMIGLGLLASPLMENLKTASIQTQIESISSKLSHDNSNQLKPVSYYDEMNIYNVMHKMANTKIIAKDGQIWGTLPMKKDLISGLKGTIEKINYPDREYLLEVLSHWENGDFSHCVEEHNYFWNKLDGTKGEAYKLKDNI